jgi:serine/threonine protein kinase/Flp pilus assembly protein TadD
MSQSPESSRVPSLERWERLRHVFHGALGRPESDRDAYLKEACGDDLTLLAEINRLFDAHDEAGAFLEAPAAEILASSRITDSKQPMSVAPGARLGAYEVISLLGIGGMGEVYRARDVRLDRPVAIKILRPEITGDLERKQRFINEAKAASALNHPNIVTIYDIGETDGTDFIVMEYVDGRTIGELIGPKGLPLEEAMRCAVQIADALGNAHSAGIVHRDIKPSNVMMTHAALVKVLDFGLAKPFAIDLSDLDVPRMPSVAVDTAEEGMLVGTAAYMSPEQARGDRVGPASDVFSLGSLLYEMITGRRAFGAGTTLATLAAVLRDEPVPIHEITADVSVDLEKFVARCLRKDPTRRFQHLGDVKLRLEEILADLQSAAAQPPAHRMVTRKGADAPASVAVLPFADLSQQRDQDYFCEGIAEELINALSKVKGLRVASRTSSFRFRGRAGDVRDIGTRLGVAHVLEGSVRRVGDRLRVTAQLINSADGYHLWSDRYDRELRDIFAVQDEITHAVVSALQERLLGRPAGRLVKPSTESLDAYDLYLRGRYHWNQWRADAAGRAAELFERAIAKDPQYAAAWAGLAMTSALLGVWTTSPLEVWEKAKRSALKALELDQSLAEAYSALGTILSLYEWDWREADRALRRSIELNPASAEARVLFSRHLSMIGSHDEALTQAQRAVELDPLAIIAVGQLASVYYYRREYERAIGDFEKMLDLDPTHPRAYYYLGRTYLGARRLQEAVTMLERGADLPVADFRIRGILGHAYALIGRRGDALRLLEQFDAGRKPGYPSLGLFSATFVHIGLGQHDQALDCLERLYTERSTLLHGEKVDPLYDPLRANPRFESILRRMGLFP